MTKFNITKATFPSKKPAAAKSKVTKAPNMNKKPYRQYDTSYFFKCLLDFACMPTHCGPSINAFLKNKEKIAKSSFLRYYHKSGLAEYKKQATTVEPNVAKLMLTNYFEKTNRNSKARVALAQDGCRKMRCPRLSSPPAVRVLPPPPPPQKSPQEKAREKTRQIVYSTQILEPIKVIYLSEWSEAFSGTAVKIDINKWHVFLENKTYVTATDKDLLDEKKYLVQCKWIILNSEEIAKKQQQSAKPKSVQIAEKAEQEKRSQQVLQKRRELELAEYDKLCRTFQSGQPYQFQQFLEMADLLRKPIACESEGREVSLMQDDDTFDTETSAIGAGTESLFAGHEKQTFENRNGNQNIQPNGGNPTVRTERGTNGIAVALHPTLQRNAPLITKLDVMKAKDRLDRESKYISTTLTALTALQQKKPDAYWIFSMESSSQQELSTIVRLLAPESGVISKGKRDLWCYIEENLAPTLSKAVVDATWEEYARRLATVTAELAALNEQVEAFENVSIP